MVFVDVGRKIYRRSGLASSRFPRQQRQRHHRIGVNNYRGSKWNQVDSSALSFDSRKAAGC